MGVLDRIKQIWNAKYSTEPKEERNLFTIRQGDIISILGEEYEVLGSISFNDEGWKWIEYKVRKVNEIYWLSVEEDDEIEVAMFKEVVAITTKPPKQYVYDGITYYMQEGSDAEVERVDGRMNVQVGMEVDYYDYCDKTGEKYLAIEIWDGEVEMSIGWKIPAYQIDIFPGS